MMLSALEPDLSLDPANPPKYCPQCKWKGVKSKVKKLKVDPDSHKLVIMCKNEKCPWPFSVKSPDEVTVSEERSDDGAEKVEEKEGEVVDVSNEDVIVVSSVSEVDPGNAFILNESGLVYSGDVITIISERKENLEYDLDLLDFEPDNDIIEVGLVNEHSENVSDILEVENISVKSTILSEKVEVSSEGFDNSDIQGKSLNLDKEGEELNNSKIKVASLPSLSKLPKVLTPLPLTPQAPLPPLFDEFWQEDTIHHVVDTDVERIVTDTLLESRLKNRVKKENIIDDDFSLDENIVPKKKVFKRRPSRDGQGHFGNKRRDQSSSPTQPEVLKETVTCSSTKSVGDVGGRKCISPDAGSKSIFDIEDSNPGDVTTAVDMIEESVKTSDCSELGISGDEDTIDSNEIIKPERTFGRIPTKPAVSSRIPLPSLTNTIYLHTGLSIEAEVLHQEDISLPTLTVVDWREDDLEFAAVKKIGTGVTLDRELGKTIFEGQSNDLNQSLFEDDQGNSVVFHVANQARTTQLSDGENLDVLEQGKNSVLLTESSNRWELGGFRKSVNFKDERERRRIRSGSGLYGQRNEAMNHKGLEYGEGWFFWRDWRVDGRFLKGFSEYLQKIVRKWNLVRNSKIDPRVQALLKEKEEETDNKVTVKKVISFFAEVFVKYLYIQTNFPNVTMDKMVDMLQKFYTLENQQFAVQIRCLIMEQQPSGTMEMISKATQTGAGNVQEASQTGFKDFADVVAPLQAHCHDQTDLNISHQSDSDPVDLSTSNSASDPVDLSTTNSVYSDSCCSVEVATVIYSSQDAVGQGAKLVQFFYRHPVEGSSLVFPPVRVDTEQEVSFVVALVMEKAKEFNIKYHGGSSKQTIQYSTEAALARSMLPNQVVAHIKRCFTKIGMNKLKSGRKECTRGKRIEELHDSSQVSILEEIMEGQDEKHSEEQQVERELFKGVVEAEVEAKVVAQEHVPTEDEIREDLEGRLFGGYLPKTVRRRKPQRTGTSDRRGRGGRNETWKKNVPDPMILGAVDYMLHRKRSRDEELPEQQPSVLSMSSLLRKGKSRRKKININFDDLTDDEDVDFKAAYDRKTDHLDDQNRRKSSRILKKRSKIDSGEYFDAQNYEVEVNQKALARYPSPQTEIKEKGWRPSEECPSKRKGDSAFKLKYCENGGQIMNPITSNTSSKYVSKVIDGHTNEVNEVVNDNYLRGSKKCPKPDIFEQVYTRKKHFEKVMKVVKRQKMKAECHLDRKYKGFGDPMDSKEVFGNGKKKIKMEKYVERKVKKAQVTKEESELIRELLEFAESAVTFKSDFLLEDCKSAPGASYHEHDAIQELEEFQTMPTEKDYTDDFLRFLDYSS